MDGLARYYARWSKSERHILYAITYMWTLKKIQQTSEYKKIRNRLTDIENKVVTSWEREERKDNIVLWE